MDIAIRSRNLAVSDSLRQAVEEKITRLSRYVDGMERAEVSFSEERNPRIAEKEICEVTMHGHGHTVRAKASAHDTLAAVDKVVDKLEHRMEKLKGKLISRSHPRRSRHSGNGERRRSGSDDRGPSTVETRIVKTKQFDIKPMTPEEAALQMELLGHDFFFFTNAETDRAAVVYQRDDGQIGLIDAS